MSSPHLSVVFLLARWHNATWLLLLVFFFLSKITMLPITSNFYTTFVACILSLNLQVFYFLFSTSFSFASRTFPILQSLYEEILASFGFHSWLLSFSQYSWRLYGKIYTESKQPLSSQEAAQGVWLQTLDLVGSFIENMDWIHLLNLQISICKMRVSTNTS